MRNLHNTINQLLIEPKVETDLEVCKEKHPILEPTHPMIDNQLPSLRWVAMHAGISVIPCVSARINMQQAYLERKRFWPVTSGL